MNKDVTVEPNNCVAMTSLFLSLLRGQQPPWGHLRLGRWPACWSRSMELVLVQPAPVQARLVEPRTMVSRTCQTVRVRL